MDWSSAHAKLHILLRKRNLLPKNSRILMAVSGGQDSLCLARLLVDLQPKWQWLLGLVHCDHRWRQDSADNAAHVLSLAQHWQVPAWQKIADTPPTSESTAREWRYSQFGAIAREKDYQYIVTGHTKSDRAETVLYNLIRGTGTDGLGTLAWSRLLYESQQDKSQQDESQQGQPPLTLVRPLLNFTRQDTADFCSEHQLPVWEDSSNQDLSFRRNRIRQELMPYLRSHFNPKVETALAQLADITAADTTYLTAQTEELYQVTVSKIETPSGSKSWEIQRLILKSAPLALQRRVIRKLLQQVISQPPNFTHIEKLLLLTSAPNASQSDPYPGGWIAKVEGQVIQITGM